MMIRYEQKEDEVILTRDGSELWKGRETAIAYDSEDFVMHKHGCPEIVAQWTEEARRKLMESKGLGEMGVRMAQALKIASGPFSAEELNDCMNRTGALREVLDRRGFIERRKSSVSP